MPQPRDVQQLALYTETGIANDYSFDPGVCVLPLAEDPPTDPDELKIWSPVVILRLHAPYRVRKMRYSAEKTNNPPVLPSPSDTGAFVFVAGDVAVATVWNTTFNNFDWTTVAAYTFVENCVSRPGDGIVLGAPPWVWNASVENASQFPAPNPSELTGAIATAGVDARVGYKMGLAASQSLTASYNPVTGQTFLSGWGYNQPSYLPGCFFNTDIANGGPTGGL